MKLFIHLNRCPHDLLPRGLQYDHWATTLGALSKGQVWIQVARNSRWSSGVLCINCYLWYTGNSFPYICMCHSNILYRAVDNQVRVYERYYVDVHLELYMTVVTFIGDFADVCDNLLTCKRFKCRLCCMGTFHSSWPCMSRTCSCILFLVCHGRMSTLIKCVYFFHIVRGDSVNNRPWRSNGICWYRLFTNRSKKVNQHSEKIIIVRNG